MNATEPRGAARYTREESGEISLLVNETFVSIQGEGPLQGVPTFFIRLTGCNLRCRYCDTTYAYFEGDRRGIGEVVHEAADSGAPAILVTGGEPLAQAGTPALCSSLLEAGLDVSLETNGTFSLQSLPLGVRKSVDVKTPGSGYGDSFSSEILQDLGPGDTLKFVVVSREDFDWARGWLREKKIPAAGPEVFFLPAWGRVNARDLAGWVLQQRLRARVQVQLHKILWGERRGV